jgi:hypothetical protein
MVGMAALDVSEMVGVLVGVSSVSVAACLMNQFLRVGAFSIVLSDQKAMGIRAGIVVDCFLANQRSRCSFCQRAVVWLLTLPAHFGVEWCVQRAVSADWVDLWSVLDLCSHVHSRLLLLLSRCSKIDTLDSAKFLLHFARLFLFLPWYQIFALFALFEKLLPYLV